MGVLSPVFWKDRGGQRALLAPSIFKYPLLKIILIPKWPILGRLIPSRHVFSSVALSELELACVLFVFPPPNWKFHDSRNHVCLLPSVCSQCLTEPRPVPVGEEVRWLNEHIEDFMGHGIFNHIHRPVLSWCLTCSFDRA